MTTRYAISSAGAGNNASFFVFDNANDELLIGPVTREEAYALVEQLSKTA